MPFRSASTAEANGADLVLPKPSGTVAGDTLIIVVGAGTVATPAGWTHIFVRSVPTSFETVNLQAMYRVAGTSEPASYTFVRSLGAQVYGSISRYSSISTPHVLAQATGVDSDKTNPAAAPSIDLPRQGLLLTAYVGQNGAGAHTAEWTAPTGMTRRTNVTGSHFTQDGATNLLTALATNDQPVPAGPTGTRDSNFIYEFGDVGGARITASIVLASNVPPNAPILLAPATNEALNLNAPNRFTWEHSDPDVDGQTAYDLRYRVVGAASWTTVSATTPNSYRDFPAGTFAAGSYEWQVRTYDVEFVGPYSPSGFFTAATRSAAPSITAPINNETIAASTYLAKWTGSATSTHYQWRRVADKLGTPDTAVVYQDSGELALQTRAATLNVNVNSRHEHFQIREKDNGLWTEWATVRYLVSYTTPAQAIGSVEPVRTIAAAPAGSSDALQLTMVNPAPALGQPAVSYLNVYVEALNVGDSKRPVGERKRIATQKPAGTFLDRAVASGVDYRYQLEAVASNGTTSLSEWIVGVSDVEETPTGFALLDVYPAHYMDAYGALRDLYVDPYTDTYGNYGADPVTSTVERTV